MLKSPLEGRQSFEQKAGMSKSCLTMQAAALILGLWLLKESDVIASCASSPLLEQIDVNIHFLPLCKQFNAL